MPIKKFHLAFLLTITLAFLSFHQYCQGRAFTETIGISTKGLGAGMLLGFALPILVFLTVILFLKSIHCINGKLLARLICISCFSLILGCGIAEAYMLHDESAFIHRTDHSSQMMSRNRAWPNQQCALVYIPHSGVHATD